MSRSEVVMVEQIRAGISILTLTCGHKIAVSGSYVEGQLTFCEPCLNGDPVVDRIDSVRYSGEAIIYLSCGHRTRMHFTDWITYEIVPKFVGTNMPCLQCKEGHEMARAV
jgi:hypothetical protein